MRASWGAPPSYAAGVACAAELSGLLWRVCAGRTPERPSRTGRVKEQRLVSGCIGLLQDSAGGGNRIA